MSRISQPLSAQAQHAFDALRNLHATRQTAPILLDGYARRDELSPGDVAAVLAALPVGVDSDRLSPARLTLRAWTAPADDVCFVELLAEDTETQGRLRVDLSPAQASALRDRLDEILTPGVSTVNAAERK